MASASRLISKRSPDCVPVCFSYPNRFKNASNWSVPNLPCMESWLTAAGFKLIWIKTWETEAPPNGGQRMFGVGEKGAQSE